MYTKWDSYTPFHYKQNLVATLLDRAYKICNSWKLIHEEFERITKTLQTNVYSKSFIESQISKYLNKKFTSSMYQRSSDQNDNTKRVFLKLPFLYTTFNHIRKEINAFFKKANLDRKLILINTTFNIGKLFQYKDRQETL